jgi:hypothetical protein
MNSAPQSLPASPSYAVARAAFLDAAITAGASVRSFKHPLRGPDDEELALDTAWLGPVDAERLLVISSGLHGVEGFAGSALQTALLSQAMSQTGPRLAQLHIHALNPFGMAWGRRVQEDGIDLNRHFVDFSAPLPVNEGYARLHEALGFEGGAATPESLAGWVEAQGQPEVERWLFSGQHTHPQGLFYGGAAPAWTYAVLAQICSTLARTREIVWVDVHTGYGAWASVVPLWHLGDGPAWHRARRLFGPTTEAPLVYASQADHFIQTGHLYGWLAQRLGQERCIPMCVEYGVHGIEMADELALYLSEQQDWRRRPQQQPFSAARSRFIEHFTPADPDWHQQTLAHGLRLVYDLLARLPDN